MPRSDFSGSILKSLSLWKHQHEAVQTVLRYVAAYRKGSTTASCLVHMPTGTGKTGVIAALSRCVSTLNCVVVIAPRIALKDQLFREISNGFFNRLNRKLPTIPKKTYVLEGSTRTIEDAVYITTIQQLQDLRRRRDHRFDLLVRRAELVIFDEGHYEPALVWREAVRAFSAPRVIFTATPYRNDLKVFDVDYDHAYSYTFQKALAEHYIRDVKFVAAPETNSPVEFAKHVVEFYDKHLARPRVPASQAPRAIIRCESAGHIRQICTALRALGRTCVGIHEAFKGASVESHEHRSVPDPRENDATFWVHQFKLLEGIDNPRFQLLALFDELRTVRTLVQQVGRIVRNPRRDPKGIGYVLDHSSGRQAGLWVNYLEYDALLEAEGIKVLWRSNEALLTVLKGAQQAILYLDGRFRSHLDISSFDPRDDLQLPLTVNVYRKGDDFDLARVREALSQQYRDDDRVVRDIALNEQVAVLWYVSFRNSPLLRTSAFVEPRFGVTIVRDPSDFVFYFDSQGGTPLDNLPGVGPPIPARRLQKLFQRSRHWKLASVALQNSNLAPTLIRTRSVSAVEIEGTVALLDDHAFVCSTAYGLAPRGGNNTRQSRHRRYVGFSSGKVSDPSGRRTTLDGYLEWIAEIEAILIGGSEPIRTFRRWASFSDPPADPRPRNILIDAAGLDRRFLTVGSNGVGDDEVLEMEELCKDVVGGGLTVTANGRSCQVTVTYDPVRARYSLESPALDSMYYASDPEDRRTVMQVLNETQAFHVIPSSRSVFYSQGAFYRPRIEFGPDFDDGKTQVLGLLVPLPELREASSEKGSRCRPGGSGWEAGSVFDLLDRPRAGSPLGGHLARREMLVCDDMNDESADFILVESGSAIERRRICFIHAKARADESFVSASDLQEVAGQAVKNLGELSQFGDARARRVGKWGQRWRSGQVQGEVRNRIRAGPAADAAWELVREAIRDPNTDREVWLVVGRTLSARRLGIGLSQENPAPVAIQVAYLLLSTATAVASVAKLRVFCSP